MLDNMTISHQLDQLPPLPQFHQKEFIFILLPLPPFHPLPHCAFMTPVKDRVHQATISSQTFQGLLCPQLPQFHTTVDELADQALPQFHQFNHSHQLPAIHIKIGFHEELGQEFPQLPQLQYLELPQLPQFQVVHQFVLHQFPQLPQFQFIALPQFHQFPQFDESVSGDDHQLPPLPPVDQLKPLSHQLPHLPP